MLGQFLDRELTRIAKIDRAGDAVIWKHPRAIRVEDARDLDVELVLAVIIKKERFSASLAFIITRARANRINMAPIGVFLRMHACVAIDFRGWGLKDAGFGAFGEARHIDRAMHRRPGRLDRVELIMDRACRAGHILDLVRLDKEWEGHIVAHQFERLAIEKMGNIRTRSGEKLSMQRTS